MAPYAILDSPQLSKHEDLLYELFKGELLYWYFNPWLQSEATIPPPDTSTDSFGIKDDPHSVSQFW